MSGQDIEVEVTPSNLKASCQVLKSHIGEVSEHDFNVLLGIAIGIVGTQSHSFVIPTPSCIYLFGIF